MTLLRGAVLILLVRAASAQTLPDTPGRRLVLQVCTKCHGAEMFAALRLTRAEWKYEVDGMVARGARANRAQARRIVDYLAANLGRP
jgi:hypothetical protein